MPKFKIRLNVVTILSVNLVVNCLIVFCAYPCPEANDILPCSCQLDVEGRQVIDCSNVTSEQDLIDVFQANFTLRYAYSFTIKENPNIVSISNVFNGMSFTRVELQQMVNLVSITDDCFVDSSTVLLQIVIANSGITASSFPFETLASFSNLKYLLIENSPLGTFPQVASSTLTDIAFSNVSAMSLAPATFDGVPNLRDLDLRNNIINNLEVNSFTIRDTTFRVKLDSNQITSVQPGSFVLSPNDITFYNEVQMYINSNELTSLLAGSFPLRDGHSVISVSDNAITDIFPGTFVMPSTQENLQLELYIYNNQITTLDESVFGEIFPYLNVFYAYGNPLLCDCDVAWILLSSELLEKLDDWTLCPNGYPLKEQNRTYYLENC